MASVRFHTTTPSPPSSPSSLSSLVSSLHTSPQPFLNLSSTSPRPLLNPAFPEQRPGTTAGSPFPTHTLEKPLQRAMATSTPTNGTKSETPPQNAATAFSRGRLFRYPRATVRRDHMKGIARIRNKRAADPEKASQGHFPLFIKILEKPFISRMKKTTLKGQDGDGGAIPANEGLPEVRPVFVRHVLSQGGARLRSVGGAVKTVPINPAGRARGVRLRKESAISTQRICPHSERFPGRTSRRHPRPLREILRRGITSNQRPVGSIRSDAV